MSFKNHFHLWVCRYKHVFDGLARIIREEGVLNLFSGWHVAVARGAMLTVGTNATYDQVKLFIAYNKHQHFVFVGKTCISSCNWNG